MSKNRFYYNKNNNKKKFDADSAAQSVVANNKAKSQDLLRPIEELQLSEATYNALKAGKVNKLADLACRTFQQMYKIQNIGKKNCIEISKAMSKFGVAFMQDANQPTQREQGSDKRDRQERKNNVNAQQGGGKERQDSRNNDSRQPNRNDGKNKKFKNENDKLNEYLTKMYAGMTWAEILMGKRQRPVVEKTERPALTETSLIKFCRKGKWGYKDWKGNVVVPPSYEEAFGFYEERACVERDGKLGYIDRQNNLVIDFKYDCATSFSEGLASVTVGEKSGYIDADGNQIVDFVYDIATPFSDGKAIVRQNDRWGVLNRENLSVFWR